MMSQSAMKAVKMTRTKDERHLAKMKDHYKRQDEYMALHGLKWNGKYWVKVGVRDEGGKDE